MAVKAISTGTRILLHEDILIYTDFYSPALVELQNVTIEMPIFILPGESSPPAYSAIHPSPYVPLNSTPATDLIW